MAVIDPKHIRQPRMLQGENVPGSVVKLKELIRDKGEEVPGKQSLVDAFGRIMSDLLKPHVAMDFNPEAST